MNTISRTTAWAGIISLCIGLAGCSKVNRENYEKLKMGMSYGEVVALLGEPDSCDTLVAFKRCTWGKEPKTITVQIAADTVLLFEGSGL